MGEKKEFFDFRNVKSVQKSKDGVWMDILCDDEPTGIRMKVVGSYSDEFKKFQKKLQNMAKKRRDGNLSTADAEKAALEMLVYCVVDWEGISLDGKAESPCNDENKRAFFTTEDIEWAALQVTEFISDKSNFF